MKTQCIRNASKSDRCERDALPNNIYCAECRDSLEEERQREFEKREQLRRKNRDDDVVGPDWVYWVSTGVAILVIIYIILTHK